VLDLLLEKASKRVDFLHWPEGTDAGRAMLASLRASPAGQGKVFVTAPEGCRDLAQHLAGRATECAAQAVGREALAAAGTGPLFDVFDRNHLETWVKECVH
jgi:hypothetical protein